MAGIRVSPVKKQYPSGVEVYTNDSGTFIGVFSNSVVDLTSTEAEMIARDLQHAAEYVRKASTNVRKKKLGDL